MLSTVAHGISSDKAVQVTEVMLKRHEQRVRELVRSNKEEWEFYLTEDSIIEDIKAERMLLFVVPSMQAPVAYMLLSCHQFVTGNKIVEIISAGGVEITPHIQQCFFAAKEVAEVFGAQRIEMTGRKAWSYLLPRFDFTLAGYRLSREMEV